MSRSGPDTRSLHIGVGGTLLALSLAMAVLLPQSAAAHPRAGAAHHHAAQPMAAQVAVQPVEVQPADLASAHASPDVRELAGWVLHSHDTDGLPFVIVDKKESRLFVFNADGELRGATPALVGLTRGDKAPDIGDRPISSITPQERITPAGRFNAMMGRGPHGEDILWVDYDLAVAIHRVVTNDPKEHRLERLKSKLAAERRITYGCINVPVAFFEKVVSPTFDGTRGVVYVLPDTHSVAEMFGLKDAKQPVSHVAGVMQTSAR